MKKTRQSLNTYIRDGAWVTILKHKEFFGKISSRALVLSVSVFLLTAIILNTVPNGVLKNALERKAETAVASRLESISNGDKFVVGENERIILTDAEGKVTYDSVGSLVGKYFLAAPIKKAAIYEKTVEGEFDYNVLNTYAFRATGDGFAYLWQKDESAYGVIESVSTVMFILTLLFGALLLALINYEAYRIKRRVGILSQGVLDREYGNPIEISGSDEIAEFAEELNKLSVKMLETEEMRRTFVSDASHELRTPLSSIQLLVDSIIQNENIDMETTREFMSDMSEQIERLTRIAERLLLLTNLDGAKGMILETVDMKKVAETVIATLEQNAAEEKVTLNCNFAEGVKFLGTSDGTYQIIFNLVENAIKYNRPGGSVRVYIFKQDGVCHLIVDDNGIGIPEEDFDLIFERFYRVDKARSRDKGGSGLGLSIVAKTVGHYNGKIKVENSAIGGARFTVTFPEVEE